MPRAKRLADVAEAGDRVKTLAALRDALARSVDACEGTRDVASLARELRDTLTQLDNLTTDRREATPLDELARRRATTWDSDANGAKRSNGNAV